MIGTCESITFPQLRRAVDIISSWKNTRAVVLKHSFNKNAFQCRMRTVRNSSRLPGGSASVHVGIPPSGAGTPSQDQAPPKSRPPGTRHLPGADPPVPGIHPTPCGQTDRCKNRTFATSLRTAIKTMVFRYFGRTVHLKRLNSNILICYIILCLTRPLYF